MKPIIKVQLLILCLSALCSDSVFSQTPTWNQDVGNIFYNNCTSCHRVGGLGTFPMMDYNDVVNNIVSIDTAITNKSMPPWKPDPNYRHFKGETCLKPEEITKIKQWITGGMPQGNGVAPTPPSFNSGSQLTNIDAALSTLNYTVSTNVDDYRTFVIPSNNTTDRYLNTAEFIPGNNAVVHHIILLEDTSSVSHNLDIADPLPGFASNGTMQQSTSAKYVALWAPGAANFQLPPNMGIKIPAGADFLIEIHYAPDHQGESDSTVINIKYTNVPNVREVIVNDFLDWSPTCLMNYPLFIPANTVKSYKQHWANNIGNGSVLSIFPHMHKIGRSYKVYTTNAQNTDTVGLINIPHWDFHWQGFYMFQKMQKFMLGEKIWGEALYDNTTNNPDNPSNPPVNVVAGEHTTDEMMITFLAYTPYQIGDENIVLDSAIFENVQSNSFQNQRNFIYPNPTSNTININNSKEFSSYAISSADGRIIIVDNKFPADITSLESGFYFVTLYARNTQSPLIFKFLKE
jgi:hypothetical protein